MVLFIFKILFGFLLTAVFLLKTPSIYASFSVPKQTFGGLSNDEVDSREQLLQLGADQCSATYCTTGSNGSTATTHCCKACSCAADCWYYGNCCPDVTHPKPTHSLPKCTADYVQNNKYYFLIEPGETPSGECSPQCYEFQMKYYVIDTCPPILTDANQENNYKCAMNYSLEESLLLDDIVFVHDNKTRTIYRNKYCAMCNNVQNTTRWRLSVTRSSKALLSLPVDYYERAQHLVAKCLLQFIPPDDLTAYDFAVCERYDNDTCPETTTNISSDLLASNPFLTNDYMRKACSFSEFPAKSALTTYKNIFCLMCNEGIQNPQSIDLNCDEAFPKGLFNREISVIEIDYRNDLRNETSVCEQEEIFDHVENVCRSLICPVAQAAVNGKCIANEQYLTNTAFKIMLHVYPINKVVFKQGGNIEPKSILRKISRDLSIDETFCPLFRGDIEIFTIRDSSYINRINFALYYYWTETCTAYYMTSKISQLYERSYKQIISLLLNFTLEEFYFILKFPPSREAYLNENGTVKEEEPLKAFSKYFREFSYYLHFPFNTLDRCPLILLNEFEYCDVVKRLVVNRVVNETELGPACNDAFVGVSDVFNKEDINGTDMMSVCVKDYFKLFKESVTKIGIVSLSVQLLPCTVWLLVLVCISVMS